MSDESNEDITCAAAPRHGAAILSAFGELLVNIR